MKLAKVFDPKLMKSSENDEMPKDAVKAKQENGAQRAVCTETGSWNISREMRAREFHFDYFWKGEGGQQVGCSGRLHTLPRDPAVQPAPSFYDFYL